MSIQVIKDKDSIHLKVYSKNNRYGVAEEDPELLYDATIHLGQDIDNINDQAETLLNDIDRIENIDELKHLNIDISLNVGDIVIDYDEKYIVNDITYDSLWRAIEEELDLNIPNEKYYNYKFQPLNNEAVSSGTTPSFSELVEISYNNPLGFICKNLNNEEQEYIDAVLALKIAEKLEQ